jgi:hypothetical protein
MDIQARDFWGFFASHQGKACLTPTREMSSPKWAWPTNSAASIVIGRSVPRLPYIDRIAIFFIIAFTTVQIILPTPKPPNTPVINLRRLFDWCPRNS